MTLELEGSRLTAKRFKLAPEPEYGGRWSTENMEEGVRRRKVEEVTHILILHSKTEKLVQFRIFRFIKAHEAVNKALTSTPSWCTSMTVVEIYATA